jgi:hypothetical protein
VIVVVTVPLHAEDVLHLPAAHEVSNRLAGTRGVTGTMTDAIGIVTASASANVTDLAALRIGNVTVILRKSATDKRTETAVTTIATMAQTVTIEKVSSFFPCTLTRVSSPILTSEKLWTRCHQVTMSSIQPSKLSARVLSWLLGRHSNYLSIYLTSL